MDQTPHNPTHIPAPPMNPEKRMPPVPPQPPADPQLRKNVTPEPSQTPDPKPLPPKPAPPADPPKKKKASPLPVILILLAVVAGGLFAGYSFLHIWSNGNCITPARCLICGKTYDSGLTHVWSEDT